MDTSELARRIKKYEAVPKNVFNEKNTCNYEAGWQGISHFYQKFRETVR